jgi:hypothetical protein
VAFYIYLFTLWILIQYHAWCINIHNAELCPYSRMWVTCILFLFVVKQYYIIMMFFVFFHQLMYIWDIFPLLAIFNNLSMDISVFFFIVGCFHIHIFSYIFFFLFSFTRNLCILDANPLSEDNSQIIYLNFWVVYVFCCCKTCNL